jgi:hypothetical protein
MATTPTTTTTTPASKDADAAWKAVGKVVASAEFRGPVDGFVVGGGGCTAVEMQL